MLILLKKEKIISCIITLCIIVGLFVFANANRMDTNTIQASTKANDNNVSSSVVTNEASNTNSNTNTNMNSITNE